MKTGKLPNRILKEMILDRLPAKRAEVLVRPGIGEDCSAVDFGEYACVLSSDPITGAASEIGRLAVHISCNDIASCGVEPLGLLVTLLAPAGISERELVNVMTQLTETAASLNVDILGGHTEITSSVNRLIINTTAIGRALKDRFVTTSGANPGDALVLTKWAGMEGAAILASDREAELSAGVGRQVVEEAKSYIDSISVIKEGLIAGSLGASAMHDVTEGGVLGALWEMCEASGTGCLVYKNLIPVTMSTSRICEYYNIDPLKLISSGCMLIACPDAEGLVAELRSRNIPAAVIGRMTGDGKKRLATSGGEEELMPPGPDELFGVIG
jgi:hydrogenase expression/formation protein HypE